MATPCPDSCEEALNSTEYGVAQIGHIADGTRWAVRAGAAGQGARVSSGIERS
jgi:hypothetical protein